MSWLDIEYCESHVRPPAAPASSSTLNEIQMLMESQCLYMPEKVQSALELYLILINEL